jgi:hypothetical protein
MKLLNSKNGYCLLGISFLALCLCGCFQATNKFYLNSDVITDNRFEGSFRPEATNENSPTGESFVIKARSDKHYIATYQKNDHWIKLDIVFFKCGTNCFADLSHLADNGSRDEPAVGPSGLDLLLLATRDRTHSAIRIRFFKNGIEFDSNYGNPIYNAIIKDPRLKYKRDEGTIILTDTTEKLQSLLIRVGSDDYVFGNKSRLIKIRN